MKELSIEEKAKRYDEAKARMSRAWNVNRCTLGFMNEIFPELKESEDERIRKAIGYAIGQSTHSDGILINGVSSEEALAWLERQGNLMKALQISNAEIGELIEKNYYLREQLEKQGKNNMGISEATKQKLEDNLNKALEKETPESWNEFLEKQGEQKPVFEMKTPEESLGIDSETYNKIVDECVYGEQKFHEGDWVVSPNGVYWHIDAIRDGRYQVSSDSGKSADLPLDTNIYHEFTIEDAKAGDVLVSESTCGLGTWYCIFKSLDGDESMTVYCYLARDGRFETKKELCFDKDPYNTKPATKEQRDQLEKEMADAGYEWDAEHRLLRKIESRQEELTEFEKAVKQVMEEAIECGNTHNLKADADMLLRLVQKPAWSEEDEKIYTATIFALAGFMGNEDKLEWLKSIKERVQPKQEWSDYDECMLANLIDDPHCSIDSEYVHWLKNLKGRYTWKPSDEQMEALDDVIDEYDGYPEFDSLVSLKNDLKKLREK